MMIILRNIRKGAVLSPALLILLMTGFAAGPFGCRGDIKNDADLSEAWRLCKEENFIAAFPLLREYLTRNPDNPAAHFLLGKCFANRTPVELTRAKGEFDMARYLLGTGHYTGVPGESVTSDTFLSDAHYETALVLLRTAMEAHKAGIALQASLGILKTALEYADKGLQLTPSSPPLIELKATIERTIGRASEYQQGQPAPPMGNYI